MRRWFSRRRRPTGVAVEAALDLAIGPCVARDRRADHERRPLGFGIGGVLTQIPAIRVHGCFLSHGRIDFLRLVAAALCRDSIGITLRIRGIVVAELHDHEIAGLQSFQEFWPTNLRRCTSGWSVRHVPRCRRGFLPD